MIARIITITLILCTVSINADANWRSKARTGEKLYEKGEYDEALIKYLEALEDEGDSTQIAFGLGNIFHSQEKFEEVGGLFQSSLGSSDSLFNADALYNLANALAGGQKYEEALEAYKAALRINPGQADYLHNLEIAQHLLEKAPEQEQEQCDDCDDNQDQQEQDQQEQEQQQQEQSEEEQQEQEQQQQQQDEQQEEQQEQEQQQAQVDSMSMEDAERLLNALQTDEREVLENLKKQEAEEGQRGKDW